MCIAIPIAVKSDIRYYFYKEIVAVRGIGIDRSKFVSYLVKKVKNCQFFFG